MKSINILLSDVKEVSNYAKSIGAKLALGFCTTAGGVAESYYSYPRKINGYGYYIHIIFASFEDIEKCDELINCADDIFIDVEKKGDVDLKCLWESVTFKKKYKLTPNLITVNKLINEILRRDNEKIVIRGSGAMAEVLFPLLESIQLDWSWMSSRHYESNSVLRLKKLWKKNYIKEIKGQYNLMINLAPWVSEHIEYANSNTKELIDVVSPISISMSRFICKYKRLDVSSSIIITIENILNKKWNMRQNCGRAIYKDCTCVSGGFPARKNELVVDDYADPVFQIGYINENNEFVRDRKILKKY